LATSTAGFAGDDAATFCACAAPASTNAATAACTTRQLRDVFMASSSTRISIYRFKVIYTKKHDMLNELLEFPGRLIFAW
jgi:hypothetical protein